jgi:hypothetical protein
LNPLEDLAELKRDDQSDVYRTDLYDQNNNSNNEKSLTNMRNSEHLKDSKLSEIRSKNQSRWAIYGRNID